jgi:hypothetical protein
MRNLYTVISTTLFLVAVHSCLPPPPRYPFRNPDDVTREAIQLSDSLEAYIKRWYAGKEPALLPQRLLPKGFDPTRYSEIKLVRYEDIKPEKIWGVRSAHEIDFTKQHGSFPDPHCTYLLAPVIYAPFKSKLIIEGEFPYCRFFSIQVTPPFDAREYRYDKYAGKGEVAIVDADMKPQPGSINPFLPGANRRAINRSYKVVYEMAVGDPSKIDPSHKPPFYRGDGSIRYGSAIQYQGPWGAKKGTGGHGRGIWDFGDIWIRYYAIDKDHFPSGGVALPKAYFQLPGGEKFFITATFDGLIKQSETTGTNRTTRSADPSSYNKPPYGWDKAFGVFLSISSGLSRALYRERKGDKDYIRKLDLGVTGRGENQPAPASYEPNATCSNYTNYLGRGATIKKGKVLILTGKLPTFPDTRNGAATMTTAQCRYWSITSYDVDWPFAEIKGMENTSLMDDELVLDKDRHFMIVYSRKEDRPVNATKENGVTWVDWGQTTSQSLSLRWISVGPEWNMPIAPNEINLPWSKTAWSGSQYDMRLIGTNNHNGFLGEYLPVAHYLTKEEFQKLGNKFRWKDIPEWK